MGVQTPINFSIMPANFQGTEIRNVTKPPPVDKRKRLDWGHSCIEDVKDMAIKCFVKHTYIGHHDPNREWSERNWIDEALARSCKEREEKIELARAGTVIDF
jgi:hypothetical protein